MMEVVVHGFILLSIILIPSFIVNGDEIRISTPNRRSYTMLSSYGITATHRLIRFKVEACQNAYVGLIFGEPYYEKVYEIGFGGESNTYSFIRVGQDRYALKLDKVYGSHMVCNTYVEFWISWDDNTINIGQGLDVTGDLFLTWTSETNLQTISSIGIATAWATGEWILYTQDETSTTVGKTTEGITTEDITTQGQTTKSITTQGQTTEGQTTEDITTEDQTTEDQTNEDQTTEDITTEDITTGDLTTQGQRTEGITTQGQTTEGQTTEDIITEDQTTEDITTEGITTEDITTGDLITADQTTEDQTNEDQTTEDITTEGITTEDITTRDLTTEDETTEGITTEGQTTEGTIITDTTTEETATEGTTPEVSTTEGTPADFQATKTSDHTSPPTSSAKSLVESILCAEHCTKSYTCNCAESLGSTTSSTPVTQYKVDKKTLSSYKRRYQSASDPRKSSFYIGCVGISVLVVSCAFIVILDFVPRA